MARLVMGVADVEDPSAADGSADFPRGSIVEIVGPMGAGKSSAAAAMRHDYPHVQQGWSLLRPQYVHHLAHAALRCTRTATWFRFQDVARPRYALKLMLHLDAQVEVLRTRTDAASVLMEEGPIFKLCWITVAARNAGFGGARLDRWFDGMRRRCGAVVRGVLWLDSDDDLLLDRLRNRPMQTWYGLKHLSDDEARRALSVYREIYWSILSWLQRERGVHVLSFDTRITSPAEISAAAARLLSVPAA